MNLRSEDYSPKLVYLKHFGFSCLLAFGKTSKHTGTAAFLLCSRLRDNQAFADPGGRPLTALPR